MFDLEKALAAWLHTLRYHRAFFEDDLEELERHLRDHIQDAVRGGFDEETAFHEALRELGDYGGMEREYSKVFWDKLLHKRALVRSLLWEAVMLKNYAKIALRNLFKHRGSAVINISGLAIGMACCLVILVFVRAEVGYDDYHEQGDHLYRLSLISHSLSSDDGRPIVTSSILWGPTMQRDYPEVLDYARFVDQTSESNPWALTYGEQTFSEAEILYADPTALMLFSWPLLRGTAETALADPYSVVLTETMAAKYFGIENPLGQTLLIDRRRRDQEGQFVEEAIPHTVTGVVEDVPRNSHFTFDFLISLRSLNEGYGGDVVTGAGMETWFWRGRIAHTYLLLQPGTNIDLLEAKFPDFLQRYPIDEETRPRGYYYEPFLQPLPEIYLDGTMSAQLAPVGDLDRLYLFSIVALFILLIACINFMNFSTARSAARAQEVGLRKVVGAHRKQLVFQFLGESILTSLLALVVAVGLAWMVLPFFYQYLGRAFVFFPEHLVFIGLGVGVIGLLVGIVAGSYPALFLSRFRPIEVLKGSVGDRRRAALLRKGLVVFQFGISTFLIIGTLAVFNQLRFMRAYELGFDQEQVLVLDRNVSRGLGASYDAFVQQLLQHPQVVDVTHASGLPGIDGTGDIYAEKEKSAEEGFLSTEFYVQPNFIDLFDLDLLAGRNISLDLVADQGFRDEEGHYVISVLVNEELVRRFGWGTPEDALGKQIVRDPISVDFVGTVVGVVKDFHYQSLHTPIQPLVLGANPSYNYIAVKIRPEDVSGTIAFLREQAQTFVPDVAFAYSFLDEAFSGQYADEERLAEIFGYISSLAILIACLGLFGLAAFTAEQRTKEIGIRKVLGASASGIALLLSKDFAKLVVVAFVVATPLAYLAIERWLEDFAYRMEVGPGLFLVAGGLALLIALLTVSYQAVKASLANPVDTLRYE